MEHGLELIQSYPGNRWKFDFYNFLISWKYWKSDFSNFSYPGNTGNRFFLFSHILEIRAAGGRRRAGGSRGCVVLPWIIFGTLFLEFCDMSNLKK